MLLIALDIDGTQYFMDKPEHDSDSLRLKKELERLASGGEAIIVHNTGRPWPWRCDGEPHHRYLNPVIADPHAIIHSAGPEIVLFPEGGRLGTWEDLLADRVTERDMAELKQFLTDDLGLELHPESLKGRYKMSCLVGSHHDQASLADVVRASLEAEFGDKFELFYWHGATLDITPRGANKNDALGHLVRHFGVEDRNVIVAGDAMNDLPVLSNPAYHRIVVGNAPATIRQQVTGGNVIHAPEDMHAAAGVLYGLERLGVLEPEHKHSHAVKPQPSPVVV